jgi:hypothetical protein
MSDTRHRPEVWPSFVPALDDVLDPPPAANTTTKPTQRHDISLGFVVTVANVLVTAIIVIGMLVDGRQASSAIITGSAYFAITTALYMFIDTGALATILSAWQREKTERYRVRAYRELGELAIGWRVRIEENRAAELQAQALPTQLARRVATLETEMLEQRVHVDPVQGAPSFVTPYDNRSKAAHAETGPQVDTTANEAIAWLNDLYDDIGEVDRSKVNSDGRLKVRMIGSSRGPGTREAGLWLIDKGVITKVPGGFSLNMRYFRTREGVRTLL